MKYYIVTEQVFNTLTKDTVKTFYEDALSANFKIL